MIITRHIPTGYRIKLWGHLGNQESWWDSSQQAYLERRILLKYNKHLSPDTWLVYYDETDDKYTILEKEE